VNPDPGDKEAPTVPEAFRAAYRFLEDQRIPFVVIGGIAASIQGRPRYTEDVDFMVFLKSENIQRLARAAQAAGFDIEAEQAETQWHFSGFVRLWLGPPDDQTAVDLMNCDTEFLREAFFRAQQTRFCGLSIAVATPEDMILFKVAAWREKDVPDAREILARHRERIDIVYLRKWAAWLVQRNPKFREAPERLEAILSGLPGPPARPEPA
jgi:predicted nucleotidyltransferase